MSRPSARSNLIRRWRRLGRYTRQGRLCEGRLYEVQKRLKSENKFGGRHEAHTSHNHTITQSHNSIAILLLIFCAVTLTHLPLLRLLYFWDEAGYYIPAAYDIYKDWAFIPHSTISNAHPPLVMLYMALAWKIFGYSPLVTRCAMLLVSAFGLLGVFRLASEVANKKVAIASVICVALY